MRGIEGELLRLRLILSESRTHDGAPLYRKIVEMAGGVIMTERAQVIRYAKSPAAPS